MDRALSDAPSPVAVGLIFLCFFENVHAALDSQVGETQKKQTKKRTTKHAKNNHSKKREERIEKREEGR